MLAERSRSMYIVTNVASDGHVIKIARCYSWNEVLTYIAGETHNMPIIGSGVVITYVSKYDTPEDSAEVDHVTFKR